MDWNSDGKKDIITGERNGYIRIYLNTGSDASPSFTGFSYLQVGGSTFQCLSSKPDIVDWNNDGKKDVLCGEDNGRVYLLINTGTDGNPVFATSNFVQNGAADLDVGSRSSPAVVDWNADGKKDLLVGETGGRIYYFENTGTDDNPTFNGSVLLTAGGSTIDVSSYSRPAVADWDNDGMFDIICGCYENTAAGHVWYFHTINLAFPYITLESTSVEDNDGDGFIERAEMIFITCVIHNSEAYATNVQATLTTTSAWCTVTQGSWPVGDMPTDAARTNQSHRFEVLVATNAPLGVLLPFDLSIEANSGAYSETHSFERAVAEPDLALVQHFVNDSSGNTNCVINTGETIQIIVCLTNSQYRAESVVGTLCTDNSYLEITHSNATFGTIESDACARNFLQPFCVNVSSNAPENGIYSFDLYVSYEGASAPWHTEFNVGEYGCDDGTGFSWIDTSGGTSLSLGIDAYVEISLGFSFPFYGNTYNTVYLVSNGYLVFEDPGTWYVNYAIPNASTPNSMIAPFWDDMDCPNGGTVRHQLFGSAPNRYWVAEWNSVPHYLNEGALTFEVILFENGTIKFQYGAMSGTYAYGNSATIGIEGPDGTEGVQYSYNQANAVSNGMVIVFDMSGSSPDTDADGLPDAFEEFYFGGTNMAGDADNDGDGMINSHELYCGTDPMEGASVFRVEGTARPTTDQFVVQWQSIPGKQYNIETCTNLISGEWTVTNPVPIVGGGGGMGTYTASVESIDQSFFRITIP